MEKSEWLSQVKRGILEYNILLIINKKTIYGYDLLAELGKNRVFTTTEGTLYPLLRRLEKDGLIFPTWKASDPGVPPRKYYDLTAEGKNMLGIMNEEWEKVIRATDYNKNFEENNI